MKNIKSILYMISINIAILVAMISINIAILVAMTSRTDASYNDNIRTLLRQTARWSAAASQDESPIVALLHANYGAGYLWALKDIATEKSIKKATGVNIHMFEKIIIGIQDKATKKVSGLCPQFYSKLNTELLVLGGDL